MKLELNRYPGSQEYISVPTQVRAVPLSSTLSLCATWRLWASASPRDQRHWIQPEIAFKPPSLSGCLEPSAELGARMEQDSDQIDISPSVIEEGGIPARAALPVFVNRSVVER